MTADISHKADLKLLQGHLLEAARQIATSLRRIDFLLDQTGPDASTQTMEQGSLRIDTGIHREPTLPKTLPTPQTSSSKAWQESGSNPDFTRPFELSHR